MNPAYTARQGQFLAYLHHYSITVIVPPESLPPLERPQGTGFKDRL